MTWYLTSGSCSPHPGSWSLSEHCQASFETYICPHLWGPWWDELLLSAAGALVLFVWLDQVLSPSSYLPGAASRVQTVTTRPVLVWVLFGCLRHCIISCCHSTLLVRFPNQSMSSLHLQTYYRLFPPRISVSSSGLLTWAHSGPPLLILPLQVGRRPHDTENAEEQEEELINALLLISFLWLPSLFPLGRQSDFFLLTLPFPSHSCQPAGPGFFFLLLSGNDFYSAYSLFLWRP